jgi:hypothetical protein
MVPNDDIPAVPFAAQRLAPLRGCRCGRYWSILVLPQPIENTMPGLCIPIELCIWRTLLHHFIHCKGPHLLKLIRLLVISQHSRQGSSSTRVWPTGRQREDCGVETAQVPREPLSVPSSTIQYGPHLLSRPHGDIPAGLKTPCRTGWQTRRLIAAAAPLFSS